MEISSCYACMQQTAELIPIDEQIEPQSKKYKFDEDASHSTMSFHIGNVIVKHFWFQLEDIIGGYICSSCWTKIKEFHQFYSEVEVAHGQQMGFTLVEIKEEQVPIEEVDTETKDDERLTEEPKEQTIEDTTYTEIEKLSEFEDDPEELDAELNDNEEYSLEEEAKPIKQIKKKSFKLAERLAESDSLIAQYCNIHCEQCSLEFPTFTELQTHAMVEHQQKAYVYCCDRKFNNRIRLFDHVQLHVDPNRFKCDICGRACLDREGLKKHTKLVHTPEEERPHKCNRCSKSFSVASDFVKHVKYHEAMETKEFQCEQCNKFFGNGSLLKQHIKINHAVTFEFVCDTCAKGFNVRAMFLKHLEEHEGKQRPAVKVQCSICLLWMLKSGFRKHMLRHNSSAVKCDQCGKECPNLLALRSHKQFSHKEAKFECNICGKMFKRAITLREHQATHSGAVLYTCPHCPKTFNSNANMHSHRKKMHPQEWLETRVQRFAKHESKE